MNINFNSHAFGKPKKKDGGAPFIYLILILIVVLGYAITGGYTPVDPNGPEGPPTVPPNYEAEGVKEEIIFPTNSSTSKRKDNLQLQTFKVNNCVNNIAVDFLVDTSGSFAYDSKMENLKKALTSFTNRMSNLSVIGMQTFSAKIYERIPLDFYKNQKIQTKFTIDNLSPAGNTRTRSGFLLAQKLITEAKKAQKFKGYQYILVLLTDGIPELNPSQPRTCIGPQVPDPLTAPALRCFAREEDPRYPNNIADELKSDNVLIYSIGIYSPNRPSDAALQPQLETLLREVASKPTTDYYFSTVHGDNLDKILDQIFIAICQ